MLLCFLQAHGSHNITPKLCLHMVPVINDGDLLISMETML